jgi:hypothetical protein
MSNSNEQNHTFNEFITIKADNINFTLDLNISKAEIRQSSQPGEILKVPYTVIQNDINVLQGIRKSKVSDFFGNVYDFITISKKTGKGMMVWNNSEDENPSSDSIASFFIQCQ